METQTKKAENPQGGETAKKKQKPSATYCLTQMGEMADKLELLKLLNTEELKTLRDLKEKAKAEYIKQL